MSETSQYILLVTAFATSTLSAIIGMGGGILLLAVMFGFMPHGAAIPLHAVVQLASNSTRLMAYLPSTDRKVLGPFAVGAIPGAVIGALALWWIGRLESSEPYLKCAVGAYVLTSPFVPRRNGRTAPHESRLRDFTLIGLLAGTMALTVGAVGPLIAPIFARRDFVKERLIATKAACQMITHVLKLPTFALLGTISLSFFGPLAVGMILAVIPGTLLGRRLLQYVSPDAFRFLYRGALLVAGTKVLVIDGLIKIL